MTRTDLWVITFIVCMLLIAFLGYTGVLDVEGGFTAVVCTLTMIAVWVKCVTHWFEGNRIVAIGGLMLLLWMIISTLEVIGIIPSPTFVPNFWEFLMDKSTERKARWFLFRFLI